MQLGKPVKDAGSRNKTRNNKGLTQDWFGVCVSTAHGRWDSCSPPGLRVNEGRRLGRIQGKGLLSQILFLLSMVHPSINPSVHLSTVHPSSTYPLSNIHPHSIHSHSIHPQSIYPSSIINPSSISTAHPLIIHPPIRAYIIHPSMGHPFIFTEPQVVF